MIALRSPHEVLANKRPVRRQDEDLDGLEDEQMKGHADEGHPEPQPRLNGVQFQAEDDAADVETHDQEEANAEHQVTEHEKGRPAGVSRIIPQIRQGVAFELLERLVEGAIVRTDVVAVVGVGAARVDSLAAGRAKPAAEAASVQTTPAGQTGVLVDDAGQGIPDAYHICIGRKPRRWELSYKSQ